MTAIVLQGDARHLPLPDASVDLICTSPPFWGQRDYRDAGQSMPGQIGSERTWQEWLANLLDCTREWVRVLKPDGNLFVELGDKYSDRGHGPDRGTGTGRGPQSTLLSQTRGRLEKCLLDLPHRYSIACTDQLGLIKRANIVWHHTNGLPESVTDRVRVAHTMVFHLVRQPRYYTAIDEIREPHETNLPVVDKSARSRHRREATARPAGIKDEYGSLGYSPLGKLPSSVWSIPSQPFIPPPHLGTQHYAAFPMELPRRLVLGWSPPGICQGCGQGRRPVSERATILRHNNGRHGPTGLCPDNTHGTGASTLDIIPDYRIAGYTCGCTVGQPPFKKLWPAHSALDGTRPAVVLDPFSGTGTSLLVAAAYGRIGIGIDRSADYCRVAQWRCSDPGERAKALQVPKPPPVPDGQDSLFPELA